MKENNLLNFKDWKLELDYLMFNKQFRTEKDLYNDIYTISDYLFVNFNFNSEFVRKEGKKTKELLKLRENQTFDSKVSFIFWTDSYNNVLSIAFAGRNARNFYTLLKTKKINWEIFDLRYISLARIDVCYFRPNNDLDDMKPHDFLLKCHTGIKNKIKEVKVDKKSHKSILKIGNRTNQIYYRIYNTNHGIQFELEIKKNKSKKLRDFLIYYHFDQFENIVTKEFFKCSKDCVMIEYCFSDWLRHYFRTQKNLYKKNQNLVTSYLNKTEIVKITKSSSLNKIKEFQRLLQFLTFTSPMQAKDNYFIGNQKYYLLEFFLIDFLEFLGTTNLSNAQMHYQRQKVKLFLDNLQNKAPYIEYFSKDSFYRSISIPYYELVKTGRNYLVRIAVAPELYCYNFPFKLPNTFLSYDDSYDLRVKIQFILLLAQSDIEKQFHVQEFLNYFIIANSKITYLKLKIIELFIELEKEGIILPKYKLVYKHSGVKHFNSFKNFNKTHFIDLYSIYFYENMDMELLK